MKTITAKIPDSLNDKRRKAAALKKEHFSETIRRALTRELEGPVDFASLAAPYRGMFRGPADLSVREGYGSPDSR